jgi:4-amino-4-deoxy-L-arabinose transferase-like glycosyltransferase
MYSGLIDSLKKIKIRHDLIYLFLFALFLRSLYFALVLTQQGFAGLLTVTPDCINYVSVAKGMPSVIFKPDLMLYTFGPGYGFFLAVFFFIFGPSGVPVIIVQIILGSLSCLLMYKLARMLTGSYAVAMTAGILAAVSYTSISLASLILSDSLYFFLFLLSLILYLRALEKEDTKDFVLSGLLVGYCILTRSIGQFWIIVMIIIAIGAYLHKRKGAKQLPVTFWRYIKRPLISVALAAGILLIWIIRNWIVMGVPVASGASGLGPSKIAALTVERLEKRPWKEVISGWIAEFEAEEGHKKKTMGDNNEAIRRGITKVIEAHPWEVTKTYLQFLWANIHDLNYFPRSHFPDYKGYAMFVEYKILRRYYIDSLLLILSLIGMIILIFRRQYYVALILGLTFAYYGLLGGLAPWQGSRIFYPGQIGWAILNAISIVAIVRFIVKWYKSVFEKKQSHAV